MDPRVCRNVVTTWSKQPRLYRRGGGHGPTRTSVGAPAARRSLQTAACSRRRERVAAVAEPRWLAEAVGWGGNLPPVGRPARLPTRDAVEHGLDLHARPKRTPGGVTSFGS